MAIGVSCPYRGKISIEECMECGNCLPRPLIKSLKMYDYPPKCGTYGLKEIIGCPRLSFYKRIIGVPDEYKPLHVLWSMKRGKYLDDITKGTGFNELEGILEINVSGETIYVRGKLDCYDYVRKEIIEVKSTKIFRDFKPRTLDIIQLQCYVTLYRDVFKEIKGLRLVYLDMSQFVTYDIEMLDRSDYLKTRAIALHESINNLTLPDKEPSYYCKYCCYKEKCEGDEGTPQVIYASQHTERSL